MNSNRTAPSRDGEEGMALILVLIIGSMLLVMGGLSLTLFQSSSTGATRHIQAEQGLQTAEQGIDQTIGRLQDNLAYNTSGTSTSPACGTVLPKPPSTVVTPTQEAAWLRANFGPGADTSCYPNGWLQTDSAGEYAAIQPNDRKTIYSISWIPSRAAARRVRVVKAEWLPANFQPEHAILTGNALRMQGNAAVAGIAGSVHANGDITVVGSSVTVEKTVTTSGTFSPDPPTNLSAGGGTTKNSPRQSIPTFSPELFWNSNDSPSYVNAWWDMCDDGIVRLPDGAGPCLGSVAADANNPYGYQGWSYKATTRTWSYKGAGVQGGVFYAHHGNIDLSGSPGTAAAPWRATLVASATPTTATCGHADGVISISGSPVMTSYGEGQAVTMLAGSDLELGGTPSTQLTGLFMAVEQMEISGNGALSGSILTGDKCHTAGTPVAQSTVAGSMTITFNKDISAAIGTTIRTTLWQELSPSGFTGS